jgi:hypothetical protein
MQNCKASSFVFSFLLLSLVMPSTFAADFRIVSNESSPSVYILITGDIVDGDYARFILKSKMALGLIKNGKGSKGELVVAINSTGGSLVEAIRIGTAIREMRLATRVGEPFQISQGVTNNHCMSACLFILAGGVSRDTTYLDFGRIKIGIHRPSFDASYYARLSVKEAERKYKQLEQVSRTYLIDMGLSESLVRQMFTIPSTEMKFLDEESFSKEFGNPPFYQEWIIANCGARLNDAEEASVSKYTLANLKEKKSSVSQVYVRQLMAKDIDHQACLKRIRLADQVSAMQKYLYRR